MGKEDPIKSLAEAIEAINMDKKKNPSAPVSEATAPHMTLPPGLCEEAAAILYEFWERNSAHQDKRVPRRWDQLAPQYQSMWMQITRIVLEMSYSVLLTDMHRFLDSSNGDLGAAFARALRRYAADVLSTRVKP